MKRLQLLPVIVLFAVAVLLAISIGIGIASSPRCQFAGPSPNPAYTGPGVSRAYLCRD